MKCEPRVRLSFFCFSLPLLFMCSVMSGCLQPHGLQHVRLPWTSLSPRVSSDSCPLSRWCHPIASGCLTIPVPFVKKAMFHLWFHFSTFVKNQLGIFSRTYFWVLCSVPLICAAPLLPLPHSLFQYLYSFIRVFSIASYLNFFQISYLNEDNSKWILIFSALHIF